MNRILITTTSFATDSPELLSLLSKNRLFAVFNQENRKLSDEELSRLLSVHRPIGLLAGTESIERPILEKAAEHLRVISRVGVGWDNIDRAAAGDLGMLIYRTPGVLTQSVAELTIGLIISALRCIPCHDHMIRMGTWRKNMGGLISGRLLGIIGFGDIGRRVGELAKAFGASVIYCDPAAKGIDWAEAVSLECLLERADIISLHADGKDMLIGAAELELLKKNEVIIVNTARGSLVDEHALYRHLKAGSVKFACLDVFAREPYHGRLSELDNVILTPHIGSYALEARREMERRAVENLIDGLRKIGALADDCQL